MVYGQDQFREGEIQNKEKPPNCCNSSAARHVSENADAICNQSNREGSETQEFFSERLILSEVRI